MRVGARVWHFTQFGWRRSPILMNDKAFSMARFLVVPT